MSETGCGWPPFNVPGPDTSGNGLGDPCTIDMPPFAPTWIVPPLRIDGGCDGLLADGDEEEPVSRIACKWGGNGGNGAIVSVPSAYTTLTRMIPSEPYKMGPEKT